MRILITGGSGQVGTELRRLAWPDGTILLAPERAELDLSAPRSIEQAVSAAAPDLIINSGAYTAVDKAETEPARAMDINGTAPGVLAELCARRRIALIQLSTDYVFDGAKPDAYVEDDVTGPLGVYGQTKLAGEQAVRAALPAHVILRTSWVYAAHGANFVRTMLRLGAERDELAIIDDQHGCPTWAGDIAATIATIAERIRRDDAVWGTFHYTSAEPTTWHGFASRIFARAGGKTPHLRPIPSSDYPTPARRPLNSVLDCGKIARAYGILARPWRDPLDEVLAELAVA